MPELIKTRWYPESVLKAYYRFESGALTTDSSGEGHTLTAISDPAEDASGKFGGAVAFDGNDAYSATDHADLKPTGDFSVGGWYKSSNAGVSQMWWANYSNISSKPSGWILWSRSTNAAEFWIGQNKNNTLGDGYQRIQGTTNVNDGNWHFIVATWDGSYMRLYVDGSPDTAAVAYAIAPVYASNSVRVGCVSNDGGSTNTSFLTGSLDDVFLLNGKALNAYEVLSIYRTISPGAFLMNLATNWKNN